MAQKIRDVAVKTGEYQDQYGNNKGRWQNVGALMKGDDGNEFIILQRWFNPAGVMNPQGKESVILSCFELRDQNGQQQQKPAQPSGSGGGPTQDQGPSDDFDSDIPF